MRYYYNVSYGCTVGVIELLCNYVYYLVSHYSITTFFIIWQTLSCNNNAHK